MWKCNYLFPFLLILVHLDIFVEYQHQFSFLNVPLISQHILMDSQMVHLTLLGDVIKMLQIFQPTCRKIPIPFTPGWSIGNILNFPVKSYVSNLDEISNCS